MEKREFIIAFQLSKTILFEVRYYTLGGNQAPYFATSAEKFNSRKTDFVSCGQAQERLTKDFPEAYAFYKAWDKHHCEDLTKTEYEAMIADLKLLMDKYNFVEYSEIDHIPTHMLADLSMLKPKSEFKTIEGWQRYMEEQKAGAGKFDTIHRINVW